jgi:hypothetical protein
MYSETAPSWKPFSIGHMYIHTSWLRMTDTMTSQNIDLSSWDTMYSAISLFVAILNYVMFLLYSYHVPNLTNFCPNPTSLGPTPGEDCLEDITASSPSYLAAHSTLQCAIKN